MKKTRIGLVLLTAVLAAACASKGMVIATTPLQGNLGSYRSLTLQTSSQVATPQEIGQLEGMVREGLAQSEKFAKVSNGGNGSENCDLRVNMFVAEIKRVDSGSRAMGGALAGKAKMLVDVELLDCQGKKQIGTFQVVGKSSGGSVFAGGTEQAIKRAAEKIVEYILQKV